MGPEGRYKIICKLGDGTFGRALKCIDTQTNEIVAVKVIRAVKRYTESARIEVDILQDLKQKGGCENYIVELKDHFMYREPEPAHGSQRDS